MKTHMALLLAVPFLFSNQKAFSEWKEIDSDLKTKATFCNNLVFSSSTTGWVQGNETKIFKTTNSGKNWDLVPIECTRSENGILTKSISFVDENNGWILRNDTLYQTINGGNSWTPINVNMDSILYIDFQTPKKGIAYNTQSISYTEDKGHTWTRFSLDVSMGSFALWDDHFTDSLTGWIAAWGPGIDGGCIMQTTNGGRTWQIFRIGYEYKSVWSIDNNHIVAAGIAHIPRCGIIDVTCDSGKTWNYFLAQKALYINDIAFLNPQFGVAVSNGDSLFLETTDSGITWNPIKTIKSKGSTNVSVRGNVLYVLTLEGKIYIYEKPPTSAGRKTLSANYTTPPPHHKGVFLGVRSLRNPVGNMVSPLGRRILNSPFKSTKEIAIIEP
jgi:photosystem II stability/assembly factor-like uncharacterized protein